MRIGLVGTGHWAQTTHVPALVAEPAVELIAVWGRDPGRARALADRIGASAHEDYDVFLAQVDAVAFSVPPDVQASLAVRAANAGKHLLLEKPLALNLADANEVAAAVDRATVASVVNFCWRFNPDHREWLDRVRTSEPTGGWARFLASALVPGSPYADSTWRQQCGALWDVGPHVLALSIPALGRVTEVTAASGAGDLVHLILRHEGSATSTVSLTLRATPAADSLDVAFWGPGGVWPMPPSHITDQESLQLAARELAANAAAGQTRHPCDARFGLEVVSVLTAAQASLASGSSQSVAP